jgi:hypothetical protein
MAVSTGTAILGAAGIGALGGMFGGKGGNTTTVQNSEPWSGLKPYLTGTLYPKAQTALNTQPTIGSVSPLTQQYQSLMANRATSGSPLDAAAQQNNLATLQGNYLSPDSNPYLRDSVEDALGMARSSINSQFGGDNFGNSAHQEWLGRGLGSVATNAYMQNYQQERQRQLGAQALAPTLANQDYTNLNALGQVGQQQDARSQAEADAPWTALQRFQQLISGQGGGTSSTQTPYFTNPMANALGFGLGGLSLYNGLNQAGLFGAPSPVGGMSATPYAGSYGGWNV